MLGLCLQDFVNLKSHFPNASKSFFDLNPFFGIVKNTQTSYSLQPAEPQSPSSDALGATDKGEKESRGRVALRYRIFRVRPQDIDNAYGSTKQITDALVLSGLIQNDDPTKIKTTIEQEKVDHFSQE